MTNAKKRLFDPALYLDSLRQLRMIGIASTVVMTLAALFIPVARLVDVLNTEESLRGGVQSIVFYEANPFAVLSFLIMAPLLTLSIFSFMNKRNGSDFYHSAPNNRLSLFTSMLAAVATWLLIALVVSTLVPVLFWLCTSAYFQLNISSALVTFFNMLAASLYVAAAIALAMCVTGTTFTNVVVSLLIIFLPRLLVMVFTLLLSEYMPLVNSLDVLPFMGVQYNIVTNLIYGTLFGGSSSDTFKFVAGGVYTLVIGLLFLVAAAVLFVRRHSESAGHSAPNRVLQAVYRLACSMVICLIPCSGILSIILGQDGRYSSGDIFMIVVLYVVALLVYFFYELITTRKWKRLLQSVPALGILVLLNMAFVGGVVGAYQGVLKVRPSADDIQSVRLISGNNDRYYYGEKSYFDVKTEEVHLEDETIREIAADRLAASIDLVEDNAYYRNDFKRVPMAIELKGRTIYRNVLLREKDLTEMTKRLGADETFRGIYLELPAIGENGTTVGFGDINDGDAVKRLYDTMRAEIQEIGFDKWYSYISQNNANRYYSYADTAYTDNQMLSEFMPYISISTGVKTENYTIGFNLPAILPKTCNAYFAEMKDDASTQKVIEALKSPSSWDMASEMTVCFLDNQNGEQNVDMQYYGSASLTDNVRQFLAEVGEVLEQNRTQTADIRQRMLLVRYREAQTNRHVEADGYEYYEYLSEEMHICYVPLPDGVLEDGLVSADNNYNG